MTRDVTGSKHDRRIIELERALNYCLKAQNEILCLFEAALDLFCVFGFDGYFRKLNPAFERVLGFSMEELTSRPFIEFVHPDDVAATNAIAKKTYLTREPVFAFENRFRCKDGSYVWLSWAAMPDKEEETVYSVGRNVTELKQAQKALAQAKVALEEKVEERTREITKVNELLQQEILERTAAIKALQINEKKLKKNALSLHEVNTALRVLLKKREEDRAEIEERVLHQVRELILPFLSRLRNSGLNERQGAYIGIIEANLNTITSPFARCLAFQLSSLTSTEIQVAEMIKQGNTTKEIAALMCLSPRTIDTHRGNIRKKLAIRAQKINLQTYLLKLNNT